MEAIRLADSPWSVHSGAHFDIGRNYISGSSDDALGGNRCGGWCDFYRSGTDSSGDRLLLHLDDGTGGGPRNPWHTHVCDISKKSGVNWSWS